MAIPLRKAGVAAAAVVVVAGAGVYAYETLYARYFQSTDDAAIQADQVTISSKLAGYVRTVAVDDNQDVGAGGLLVEIDPVDYQTKLSAADAEIASALAAENAAKAGLAEAGAAVDAMQAKVNAAQTDLDFAEREMGRNEPLVKVGVVSTATLSQLTANRDRAAAEGVAARAAVAQARRHVESITAESARLAAQADAARVQRQAAANDVAATRLTAPMAGRVAGRSVRVGQYVMPGMRLLTIVPSRELYVVANFKETQVGLMRRGQPASIRVDALPGVTFAGEVESITPGTGANFSLIPPQNATGNFTKIVQRVPVRIKLKAGPAAQNVLVPGLSLDVEVDTRKARDDLHAIVAEQEGARP